MKKQSDMPVATTKRLGGINGIVVFMKEPVMRFAYFLVLGLTIALLSGCSNCDQCRLPLLQRLGGRSIFPQKIANSEYITVHSSSNCACDAAVSGQEQFMAPVVPPMESDSNAPLVEPQSNNDIPDLPSSKIRNGAPELNGTIEPSKDDSSFLSPSQLFPTTPQKLPKRSGPPVVAEQPMYETLDEAFANINPEKSRSQLEEEKLASEKFLAEESAEEPAITNVLKDVRQRIKVQQISNPTRIEKPRIMHESKSVPYGASDDNSVNESAIPGNTLPAAVEPRPVVLRATPAIRPRMESTQFETQPRRVNVADASSVDEYGLPNSSAVPFQELPPVRGNHQDIPLSFPNTNESKFEEPPKDSQAHEFESLPAMKPQADNFTTKTSYQSPSGNQTWGNNVSDFIEVVNPSDQTIRPRSHKIESDVDSVFRVVQGSNAPPIKQVQILRLKAATPMDHTSKFPIVSINLVEPIIIRGGVHPDVMNPIVVRKSPVSKIPSRPVFDENRLEASIRGLTSRPIEPKPELKTIDR